MSTAAWILDLDETLVRSAAVWQNAESALYEFLGSSFDHQHAPSYSGLGVRDVASAILSRVNRDGSSVRECEEFLRDRLYEFVVDPGPEEIDGATMFLRRLAHVPAYIASGSPKTVIARVVSRFGWDPYVDGWVSSEEVPRGKPEPDVFLAAARLAGAKPSECLVVEDSLFGVKAAKSAGMSCIAIPSEANPEICRVADSCRESLDELGPDSTV